MSLLGRPRLTEDVDALLWLPEESWDEFIKSGADFGFTPRLPDAVEFARQARMFLVRHDATGIPFDLMAGALPFEEEAVGRAQRIALLGVDVPVVTAEDLIIMKAVAHRSRDIADIESVLEAQPDADLVRVRRWVGAFAEMMDLPDLLDDIEAVLLRSKGGEGI